jgi:hypothetical protein
VRHVTADDLAAARAAGRRAAEQAINEQAPTDPTLKIAWAKGYGSVDAVDQAVEEARDVGITWRKIAEALGENHNTVRVRYTQPDRTHRWKARRDAEGGDG